MAYMEGCRDGPRLRAALALAQERGKPVVMCKVGTSALGAAAAASHTASLAGNDAVYDAVFRRYGVLRAHSITVPPSRGLPRGGPSDCSRSRAAWAP